MAKFVPLKKMSKKRQKSEAKKNRLDWGGVKPISYVEKNGKAYERTKIRHWEDDFSGGGSFFAVLALRPQSVSQAPENPMASTSDGFGLNKRNVKISGTLCRFLTMRAYK